MDTLLDFAFNNNLFLFIFLGFQCYIKFWFIICSVTLAWNADCKDINVYLKTDQFGSHKQSTTSPYSWLISPNSDKDENSLYIITSCSNIHVRRIKEMNTKDKMSWYLDKFSLLIP